MALVDAFGNPIQKKVITEDVKEKVRIAIELEQEEEYLLDMMGKCIGSLYNLFKDYHEAYTTVFPDHNAQQSAEDKNKSDASAQIFLDCVFGITALILRYKTFKFLTSGLKEVTIYDIESRRQRTLKVDDIEFYFPSLETPDLSEEEIMVYRQKIKEDLQKEKEAIQKIAETINEFHEKENPFAERLREEAELRARLERDSKS